ncbi:peptidylprolyl isomerase [Atopobacter sp. AH10]|uniref:peptidylprolyl isomerase n=1 Tax=Atopobacter sp. AH10 TaxID=2315861 RepID=UPI000EF1B118|nr:peptidylprolyl isomerase [Atopobacter sp. AH10]RLK62777.1 peptidylprolyl isomerase [Atopobacter sp. AH10]
MLIQAAEGKKARVKISTSMGDIALVLYDDLAPLAVKNFLQHAQEGYYDKTIFHRVIPQFMIQGGDPTGTGRGGESIYGHPFENECHRELFHFNGALSMANAGPNTNGSQFFIVCADQMDPRFLDQMRANGWPEDAVSHYQKVGGTPWLDGKHTVFGQVLEGMEVVKAISETPRNQMDRPHEDVVINSIQVEEQ